MLIALLLNMAPMAEPYDPEPYFYQDTKWTVARNNGEKQCQMMALYANATKSIIISYDNIRDSSRISLQITKGKDLEEFTGLHMDVWMEINSTFDRQWQNVFFIVTDFKSGSKFFTSQFIHGKSLFPRLRAATRIGFIYKGDVVEVVPLEGSAVAAAQLKRCAATYGEFDPFAKPKGGK